MVVLTGHHGWLVPRLPMQDINAIAGVVECGLFVDMATHAYLGMPSGQVTRMYRGGEA